MAGWHAVAVVRRNSLSPAIVVACSPAVGAWKAIFFATDLRSAVRSVSSPPASVLCPTARFAISPSLSREYLPAGSFANKILPLKRIRQSIGRIRISLRRHPAIQSARDLRAASHPALHLQIAARTICALAARITRLIRSTQEILEQRKNEHAKTKTRKERSRSLGPRPRLHGHELFLRPAQGQTGNDRRCFAPPSIAASPSSTPPKSTARSPTKNWSAKRSLRSANSVVIATKFGFKLDPGTASAAGPQQPARAHQQAVEGSLKRLKIDVIDLSLPAPRRSRTCRSKMSPAR